MFKQQKFGEALTTYESALDYVENLGEAGKDIILSLRLNMAITGTKAKEYKKSIAQATKVLEAEGPQNAKALYWRAVRQKDAELQRS